eukprot:760444-Hanusia_phi.AAC.8
MSASSFPPAPSTHANSTRDPAAPPFIKQAHTLPAASCCQATGMRHLHSRLAFGATDCDDMLADVLPTVERREALLNAVVISPVLA